MVGLQPIAGASRRGHAERRAQPPAGCSAMPTGRPRGTRTSSGCWPRGPFLVSSEIRSGQVTHVELTSQVGGSVSVKDPWSTGTPTVSTVDANGNVTGSVSYTLTNGIIQFATTAGQSYTILQGLSERSYGGPTRPPWPGPGRNPGHRVEVVLSRSA